MKKGRNYQQRIAKDGDKINAIKEILQSHVRLRQIGLTRPKPGIKIGESRPPQKTAKQYSAFGEQKSMKSWSEDPRCVVSHKNLHERIFKLNWPIEKALTQKSRKYRN